MPLKRISYLLFSLMMLGACTRVHPKVEISENVCSQFSLQGSEWTPHQIKTGLSCVLYGKGHPSKYFEAVASAPDSEFVETTRWLNARLAREHRAEFLGQLEDFPAEFAAILEDPEAAAFFSDPSLADNIDFLSTGLSTLALNEGELYRSVSDALAQLNVGGLAWAPSPALIQASVDFGLGIQRIDPKDRPAFLASVARMMNALADLPTAQRALGLMGQTISCHKGKGGSIDAPLDMAMEEIVAHRKNPTRFFALITQTYAPWRNLCDPEAAFDPASMEQVFNFMRSNYGDLASFAPIALTTRIHEAGSAFLVASAEAGNGNPLPALKATNAHSAIFRAITRPGPGTDWLAKMPPRDTLLALTDALAKTSAMRHFINAGPEEFLRMESLMRVLAPDAPLLREWQTWMKRIGPELMPAVGSYAREGHFRTLSQDIQKWTREKSVLPIRSNQVPVADLALPETPAEQHSCGPVAQRIIDQCLARPQLGVAASYSCLRQNAPASLSYSFFESPSFEAFTKRVDTRDPMFRMARAIHNSGWLANQGFDRFVLNVIDALAPYRVNAAATISALSKGQALQRADLEAFIRIISHYRFPKLNSDRLIHLGYPFRDPKPDGLPENWMTWLGTEYPDQLVEALFGDPQTLHILSFATHTRVPVKLKVVQKDQVSEATFTMNGLELIDALIWEVQVKPLFGHGDRFIMRTIVHDMMTMQTTDQVQAWLVKTSGLLDKLIPVLHATNWMFDNDTVPRLENARALVEAIKNNVSLQAILTATQMGVRSLPVNESLGGKTAIFALQHRLGLFVSLSKWMEAWRTDIDAGRIVLDAPARAQLAGSFKVFMHMAKDQDILDISRANLISDGSLLGSGMSLYVSTVMQRRAAITPWISGVVSGLGIGIMTQFAAPTVTHPYEQMQSLFMKANPILDDIALRLSVGDGPESIASLIDFTAVRASETSSLRDADLVQRLTTPQGRAEMVPWVRSGGLSSLINWSRLVRPPNS